MVLERRGSDATLAEAVRAIRAREDDPAAVHRLARGHRAYAAGRAAYRALDYPTAGRWFAQVLAAPAGSPALHGWAAAFRGATLMYAQQADSAEQLLRPLMARVDTARHPGLGAQARLALGSTLFRARRYQEALVLDHEAARLFEAGGEQDGGPVPAR